MNTTNAFSPHLRRTWAEIDLDAAEYNFNSLKQMASGKRICTVVKANAYGHGAVQLGRLYERLGADYLAVSNLDEALELRRAGITAPVLVLGAVAPEAAALAADGRITLAVYSYPFAKALSRAATAAKKTLKIHLKFDTGMGRIGFIPKAEGENSLPDACLAASLPGLDVEGAFTHFAVADGGEDESDLAYTSLQAERFAFAVGYLAERGITPAIKHVSNSAAVLDRPELALDMVRLGISLYGLAPSDAVRNPFVPKPVMTFKSVISHIKTVEAGTPISYGRAFVSERRMRVATVPVGYADGFFRASAQSGARLTVRGIPVPIIGRICMDQLMIDVSAVEDVQLFEEVLIFGAGASESADSVAAKNGTIGYEITCAVARRVPRLYLEGGVLKETVDYLEA